MFITRALMVYIRLKHIPGKITSGKHRLIPRITPGMKAAAVRQLLLEEQNLECLHQPYLTEEEEYRHMVDSGINQEKCERATDLKRSARMLPHRSMQEHLDHLNVSKKWE